MNDPHEVLEKYWGFKDFRDNQESIIQSILNKQDTLSILPTGAGKSLCYQIPSLCLENCTLVISPLIALMQNQVQNLKDRNIFADLIYSGLSTRDIDRIMDNARSGQLKLLYLSPERLLQSGFIQRLQSIKINFVAIDEAHCVSQWGHDFRPSYLEIKKLRENIDTKFLALTATATTRIKDDIIQQLGLIEPRVIRQSAKRPQLSLSIRIEENKLDQMRNILTKFKNSGIIYSRNRRLCVEVAEELSRYGFKIKPYHAGMDYELRKKNQEEWMSNNLQFISCTTAFGMGIDKADVDLIVHMELPSSIEEYYQEVGRAGRGNQKAYGLCLYNERDKRRLIKMYNNAFPHLLEVQQVYKGICLYYDYAEGSIMQQSEDFELEEFCNKYHLNPEITVQSIKLLVQSGWISATQAFYSPSRVQILSQSADLEDYYKLDEKYKLVLVNMLRIYEGIFHVPVVIKENVIAFQSKLSVEQVTKILHFLHREEVIHFKAQSEKVQIQILNERVHSSLIKLDEEWIAQRKKILKEQIESVLNYLNTEKCRQIYILEHFGESEFVECGICDNCLRNKKSSINPEMRKVWRAEIISMCNNSDKISLRKIYQFFPSNKQHWVEVILQELIGENIVLRENDFIKRIDKK
ncbi:MAG: RecQ family ATP-dependent DNA helicase [Saprospiraceae bacterium]